MARDDYAIVVGISRYPGYDALSDLRGPENDVANFINWLNCNEGGDVQEGKIKTVLSSQHQPLVQRPVYQEVDDLIDQHLSRARNQGGRAGRRLYLFFAGHGIAPDINTPLLLAANARSDRLGSHMPGRAYADFLTMWGIFDEVVLFMDCCQTHMPRAPLRVLEWGDQADAPNPGKSFYGFATSVGDIAREMKMDNGKVQGVFTTALVEGLGQGKVSGSELEGYIFNRMAELLPAETFHEPKFPNDSPNAIHFGSGGGGIKATVIIHFDPPEADVDVALLDGTLQTLNTRRGADRPWRLELAPGYYGVAIDGAQRGQPFGVIGASEVVINV